MARKKLREFTPAKKFAIHGSAMRRIDTSASIAPCSGKPMIFAAPSGKRVSTVRKKCTAART